MRLSTNPAQWGAYILQALIQQFPIVEPYVQYNQALGGDTEGNGYGIIPVNNAVIPYVVRGFELKPFDTLITMSQGEPKFAYLSEANLMVAFNNVTMGEAVDQLPETVTQDVFLDMVPPYAALGNGGGSRRPAPGVQRSFQKVKLSGMLLDMEDAQVQAVFDAMKSASAASANYAMMQTIAAARDNTAIDAELPTKAAGADGIHKLVTVDPRPSGEVQLGCNGRYETVALKTAAALVKAVNADDFPRLLAGELLVYDYRPGYKQAAQADPGRVGFFDGAPYKAQTVYADERQRRMFSSRARFGQLRYPGWYDTGRNGQPHPRTCRVFNTKQLNGKPSAYQLMVFEDGYAIHPQTSGVQHAPSTTPQEDKLAHFYRKAEVRPGEVCFLVYHETDEASVPFRINSVNHSPTGVTTLQVTPLMLMKGMSPMVSLSFGGNKHTYVISPSEIAFPQRGYTIFSLHPHDVSTAIGGDAYANTTQTVHVRVFKGGGLYRVQEQSSAPSEPFTRGQFVQFLMSRYGMDADIALKTLDDINSYKYDRFVAPVLGQPNVRVLAIAEMPMKLAMDLYTVVKAAAGLMNGQQAQPAATREPGTSNESGPGNAAGIGDPNSTPSGSGRGAPNALDTSAGVPPQLQGVAAIADSLLGYATSLVPEDELTEMNQTLMNILDEAENLLGRLLLLARMGKLKYLTELELQRMFRECDKFRANLVNMSVARGNFTAPAV